MKKIILALTAATVLFAPGTAHAAEKKEAEKGTTAQVHVALCHKNRIIISPNVNSLKAHLGHGDVHLGTGTRLEMVLRFGRAGTPCGAAVTTTTQPPTTTTVPTVPPTVPTTVPPTTVTVPEAPHVVCPDGNGFTFKQAPGPCPPLKSEVQKPTPPVKHLDPRPAEKVTRLAETGAAAGPMGILGTVLLGLGLAIRRMAKR